MKGKNYGFAAMTIDLLLFHQKKWKEGGETQIS